MMDILVTTHVNPDTDALFAAAVPGYMHLGATITTRFDSAPDPTWHDPARGRYTVDVGRGQFDHHQLENSRSTCAFSLVCEYFLHHGDDRQRFIAAALLDRVAPSVLRQDSTGSISAPRDPVANLLGLPAAIDRLCWSEQHDDHVAFAVAPIIRSLFDEQVAAYEAHQYPERVLAQMTLHRTTSGRVIGVEMEQVVGQYSPLSSWRSVLAAQEPAQIAVSCTRWLNPDGTTKTWSRGVGVLRREDEKRIDIRSLLAQIQVSDQLATEIASWHIESWWGGCGGLKYPRPDAPPAGLVAGLADQLAGISIDTEES